MTTTEQRIRGPKLQAIRKAWLRQHPLCVRCKARGLTTVATQLDHIVALTNGGLDFDMDQGKNRQGLCDECHKQKTAEDLGHTYRPTMVLEADGWPRCAHPGEVNRPRGGRPRRGDSSAIGREGDPKCLQL